MVMWRERRTRRFAAAIAGFALAALMVVAGDRTVGAQGVTGQRHDVNKPIEFSADRLQVEKEGRIASFEGHVKAIQGDLSLSADVVRVFFKPSKTGEESSEEKLAGVSRIDANGNVVLASPTETAKGDWGVYDVDRRIITLGGTVELTRGDTVILGNRLELDLETGRSRIESVPLDGQPERVRGTFKPAPKSGQ